MTRHIPDAIADDIATTLHNLAANPDLDEYDRAAYRRWSAALFAGQATDELDHHHEPKTCDHRLTVKATDPRGSVVTIDFALPLDDETAIPSPYTAYADRLILLTLHDA